MNNRESDGAQEARRTSQSGCYEIIEHVDISDETAKELSSALTGHSLIEDYTIGGYMIAKLQTEESNESD